MAHSAVPYAAQPASARAARWTTRTARLLLFALLLFCVARPSSAADARFDLVGPRIDVRVTRAGQTLPIASVPNLQVGDRLWIHPDLPESQSVKYLLICVFLRGTTNPPPENWFFRIDTWDRKVREEGSFVTVPEGAQQAVLFMAPETGGDFGTLKSAVQGRPGAFVRASQDLTEAGFEEARIEKYIADIRRVPPADSASLLKHSDLLARTLDLKPNEACFKQPVDTQFTCLTQSGSQIVLDDGHGQSVVAALSSGPSSDFIAQASYTQAFGAGVYSAYVGAVVDLVRIMANLHTAQYQYIPAISFPQGDAMNLRLNTPPSFHNPKSVLVIALPSIQAAVPPPLRPADPAYVACLLKPSVTLPIEGAPLVFSTDFAHDLVLHLNTPPGAPAEPDIPLTPDAYAGGLVLQQLPQHHVPLSDPTLLTEATHPSILGTATPQPAPSAAKPQPHSGVPGQLAGGGGRPGVPGQLAGGGGRPGVPGQLAGGGGRPTILTGTIQGLWGFNPFTGPTLTLQQRPGRDWTLVPAPDSPADASSPEASSPDLIAGHTTQFLLSSTGSACVDTIITQPPIQTAALKLAFKPDPRPGQPNLLAVTLPPSHDLTPGDLHLAIQQYDQPAPDRLSARTFAEPAHVTSVEFHAGDRSLLLDGARLNEIASLTLGDLPFAPTSEAAAITPPDGSATALELTLAPRVPTPSTHPGQHLEARIDLHDGRSLTVPITVSAPRPVLTLLRKTVEPELGQTTGKRGDITTPGQPASIALTDSDALPLSWRLTFTLKTPTPFPRNGQIEVETLDGTLRTVLTLAPSGGLVLQDPRTIVATLDPLSSFGPSAFGALRVRAIYPTGPTSTPDRQDRDNQDRDNQDHGNQGRDNQTHSNLDRGKDTSASNSAAALPGDGPASSASDWLPLVTLVRLPQLTLLQCPPEPTQPCTLDGANLFLLQAISTSPDFANPVPIPDGYTGDTLTIPHPSAATLFLKLRDDPGSVGSAILPVPPPPVVAHLHTTHHHRPDEDKHADEDKATQPAADDNASAPPAASPSAAPAAPVATPPASTPSATPPPAAATPAPTPKSTTSPNPS